MRTTTFYMDVVDVDDQMKVVGQLFEILLYCETDAEVFDRYVMWESLDGSVRRGLDVTPSTSIMFPLKESFKLSTGKNVSIISSGKVRS